MTQPGDVWRLYGGEKLLAEMRVTGSDFPWTHASLSAQPAFAAVAPLFAEELRLIDLLDDVAQQDAWELAYDRVQEAVSLTAPNGRRVPEYLLHIDGEHAWWRWSDTPFD